MTGDRSIGREAFVSYLNDEDKIVTGWVTILEQTENYLKFKTNAGNIITIGYQRLIKMKERGEA